MESLFDQKQVASIFSPYIGQHVLMWGEENNKESGYRTFLLTRVGIGTCSGYFNEDDKYICSKEMYSVTNFILKLKPVAKISREDALELWRVVSPKGSGVSTGIIAFGSAKNEDPSAMDQLKVYDVTTDIPQYMLERADVRKFLTDRGYAPPVFIDVGHPLNGKTAIELGLARE